MGAIEPEKPSSVGDPLSEPRRMLELLRGSPTQSGWMPSELGDILTHQLDVPLQDILPDATTDTMTLRQFLSQPAPPPVILERLKQSFKEASVASEDSLPKEVATVLYIAVIVVAGRHTTRLDDVSLRERVDWASRRRWLDPMLADLLGKFHI